MKKKTIVILIGILFLMLIVFTGCAEKEPEPLRICVDIDFAKYKPGDTLEADMKNFLTTRLLEACGQKDIEAPKDIVLEYIPESGQEREIALGQIRTEIMSGGGPDLFIVACNGKTADFCEEALFTVPEKAMEQSLFLTLDDYMENHTNFSEWDRMQPTVLAAGRTADGQQIVPLCYTLPVSVYLKEDVEHTPSKETTWMDMLESEDEALAAAAVWTDHTRYMRDGMPFMLNRAPMTEFILGDIADYGTGEFLFTEEELKQRLDEILDLADRYKAGEFDSAPVHYVEFLGQKFDMPETFVDIKGIERDTKNGIEPEDAYTMIPLYSDDGGVTAEITAFTAINRNTERPEDAYLIMDFLMSYNEQRSEGIYQTIYSESISGESGSIPMYNDLMSEDQRVYRTNPVRDVSMEGWCLSDENFAELCEVREQITRARFRSELDFEFTRLFWNYSEAIEFGDPDKTIEEGYKRLQRVLME